MQFKIIALAIVSLEPLLFSYLSYFFFLFLVFFFVLWQNVCISSRCTVFIIFFFFYFDCVRWVNELRIECMSIVRRAYKEVQQICCISFQHIILSRFSFLPSILLIFFSIFFFSALFLF